MLLERELLSYQRPVSGEDQKIILSHRDYVYLVVQSSSPLRCKGYSLSRMEANLEEGKIYTWKLP